jgi:hypothetical protein
MISAEWWSVPDLPLCFGVLKHRAPLASGTLTVQNKNKDKRKSYKQNKKIKIKKKS